jgi:hypothetical protein
MMSKLSLTEAIAQLRREENDLGHSIEQLISRRDDVRAQLSVLISKHEREEHSERQMVKMSGAETLSNSTVAALREGAWSKTFDWSEPIIEYLQRFNVAEFRPFQREIINATLAG